MFKKHTILLLIVLLLVPPAALHAMVVAETAVPRAVTAPPEIPAVTAAMQDVVARQEAAGAVTLVATPDKIVHLSAVGFADIAAKRPMQPDTIVWIASMTKPVTAAAILMLQDEGKLSIDDPADKYLPELAGLKTADGKSATVTLRQMLTHTSGMAEAEKNSAKTLAELIPLYAKHPLKFVPGSRWAYCQSGINSLGRIVEVVSGQPYQEFLQKRLFDPLGMKDTTFFPTAEQLARMAKPYKRVDGKLVEQGFGSFNPADHDRYPAPNGGLFSTATDYARFLQMLLNKGTLHGRQYLKPETVKLMTTIHTGDFKAGWNPGHGWGLGVAVLREPQGVTATLSPGTFGHVGAFGTHGWADPARQLVHVLLIQRTGGGFDDSEARRAFHTSFAAWSSDPLSPYLDGKAPEILRELPATVTPPENITIRRVVFRSKDDAEIFAFIATPKAPGKHPGMLVLHGGGGCAEVDKAMAWAQRGYVAVAPDLPGIAEPKKLTVTKGKWSSLKYGEGRWVATPDAGSSVICDAVVSAMKSLYLLRSQPDVDTLRIGVVGVSWGGYMTTMVCGLAGDQVKAGFALYGCGFFDRGGYGATNWEKISAEERDRWLLHLDAGRRVPNMKAAYFLAAASNDFFGYATSAQATLDAIPGEKNHLFAPNANHKISVPGGSSFDKKPAKPFTPTAFQPFPTPEGQKANWLAMEVPYFDYYLKDVGQPFPKVAVEKSGDPLLARFSVTAPHPLTKVEVYWAAANPDARKREWLALPAAKVGDNLYETKIPAEAADWFALVSDDRPVTVSGRLTPVATP